MKVLFITCAPLFPTNSGYKQSVLGRVHEYVVNGAQVEVVEIDNERLNLAPLKPEAFHQVKTHRVQNVKGRSITRELKSIFGSAPRYQLLFGNKDLQAQCLKIVEQINPDRVVAESIWAAAIVPPQLFARTTLIIHDVAQHFFFEMARTTPNFVRRVLFALDWLKVKGYERRLFKKSFHSVKFLTDEDKNWYLENFDLSSTSTSRTSNKLFVQQISRNVDTLKPFVLFPGSLEFAQNFVAMRWYAEEVEPQIDRAAKMPVVVTGRCSDALKAKFQKYEWINFVGEVTLPELERLFATCTCVVSPIISGTGIKIKILEATQRGIPVIATLTSSRGVNSELCYKASDDRPETFARVFSRAILENCVEKP